jgi:DNA-binding response OmpR family regulator
MARANGISVVALRDPRVKNDAALIQRDSMPEVQVYRAAVVADAAAFDSLASFFPALGWQVTSVLPQDIARRLGILAPDLIIVSSEILTRPDTCEAPPIAGLVEQARDAGVPILVLPAYAPWRDGWGRRSLAQTNAIGGEALAPELRARLAVVLRHTGPDSCRRLLVFQDVTMDVASHRVFRGTRKVRLQPTGFSLLKHLLEHPYRIFPRGDLIAAVWGPGAQVLPRTVDVHIRRLRASLNSDGLPDYIRSVPAIGYGLEDARGVNHS